MTDIMELQLELLRKAFTPLIGLRITWLSIPGAALGGFEPSQVAVIVNTLLDGILPQIQLLALDEVNAARLAGVGLSNWTLTVVEPSVAKSLMISMGGCCKFS